MRLVFALVWLCAATASAPAQEGSETRVALVIGNGAYAGVGNLENPARDATAVARALREAGFQSVQVETDLSREAMRNALRRFEGAADKADWALVYYAGHGIEVGGVNYLVPVDAQIQSDREVDEETVSLPQVQKRLEGARRLRLVILDACRDNPFAARMRRTRMASRSVGRGLAVPDLPQTGSLVAYSAAAGQVALDGETAAGNSPYAAALVKNLAVPDVEVNIFFRRVRAEVLRATGNKQEPATYESLPDDRYILRPAPPVPPPAPPPAQAAVQSAPPAASPSPMRIAPTPTPASTAAFGFVEPQPSPTPSVQDSSATAPQQLVPELVVPPPASMAALAPVVPQPTLAPDPAELIGACDRLAASPFDQDRPKGIEGVDYSVLDGAAAVPACRTALAALSDRAANHRFSKDAGSNGLEVRRTQFQLGRALARGKSYGEAKACFEEAASGGSLVAMTSLGSIFAKGSGLGVRDAAPARNWYEKAAAAGEPGAMNNLGVLYEQGWSVPQSYRTARSWYEKAAAAGDPGAMYNLGKLSFDGYGMAKSSKKGTYWYERAAAAGYPNAMHSLGMFAMAAGDYSTARTWFEKAAARGVENAMSDLGHLYKRGQGVKKDYALARDWYEKAVASGSNFAISHLETLYEEDLKDKVEAKKWKDRYERTSWNTSEDTNFEMR